MLHLLLDGGLFLGGGSEVDYGGNDFRKMVVFSDFYSVLLFEIMVVSTGDGFFGEGRFPTNVTTIYWWKQMVDSN